MFFSSRLSKFGKGKNISAIMDNEQKISVYCFEQGIIKKEVLISDSHLVLNKVAVNLPYNEVIPVNNYFITRIDKSIGIINNDK